MARTMMLGWQGDGRIRHAIHEIVAKDDDGEVVGLIDVEAHELAGGSLSDVVIFGAVGVEELPALPDRRFPPVPVAEDDPPSRLVFVMGERQTYRNVAGTWELEPAPPIAGAGTWPEHLGDAVFDFDVELRPGPKGGSGKIRALVHRTSGHRRERAALEAEIGSRVQASIAKAKRDEAAPEPVDIGDLMGAPHAPIMLDADGRTVDAQSAQAARPKRPALPVVPGSETELGLRKRRAEASAELPIAGSDSRE